MRTKLLLVLTIMGLVIAACGGDAEEETTTTSTTEAAETTTTTAAPPPPPDPVSQAGDSLVEQVITRDLLHCGVNETLAGFGFKDESGQFAGFDVDLCRAVAAAVTGSADKVRFESLTAAARFEAVNSGLVDLLSRNTTWTQSRDTDLGLDFGPTTYYDGQQLMGKQENDFTSMSGVSDIDGATVCTNAGTTTEKNIAEVASANGIEITLQTFEDFNIVMENFKSGACDVVTTDGSGLVSRKATDATDGPGWVIFPSRPFSKEPLGPAWAQNDSKWGDVVRWTIYAQIIAEEMGITSANVDDMVANPPNGEASRLLGASDDELQTKMGLQADAFYNVIKQVGNYGEVYDRHLTPLGLERGLNALWSNGGLIFAPPAR